MLLGVIFFCFFFGEDAAEMGKTSITLLFSNPPFLADKERFLALGVAAGP